MCFAYFGRECGFTEITKKNADRKEGGIMENISNRASFLCFI